MRIGTFAMAGAAALMLAACGGDGDDALGDRAEDQAEAKAENMYDAADNMTGPAAERMEEKAEAVEAQGERREEAIDNSDVDTDELTEAQKNAMVNR